jgi:polysaccharide biosynthesis protein PelE
MQLVWVLVYGAPLAADLGACALVLSGRAADGVRLHLLAAGLAWVVTRYGLRRAGARPGHPAAFAAALLTLVLPGVGAAILAVVAWPSWNRKHEQEPSRLVEVALPDGSIEIGDAAQLELARGAQQPIRQLLRDADSPERRVAAVMALRHMDARRAVPLLRLAFSHDSEDVRLLAFGILEQREKRLRTRIKQTENRLASAALAGGEHGRWHRRLARDHWELVYAGFVSGDLEPVVLDKARQHAQTALGLAPDAKMAVLLARIHLRRRQPELAWEYLTQADHAGLSASASAPLFAEAAFQMRRFGVIPVILRGVPRAELRRAELEPVAEFWTSEA